MIAERPPLAGRGWWELAILRGALIAYVLLCLGFAGSRFGDYIDMGGSSVAFGLLVSSELIAAAIPPAILLLALRNPPAELTLDLLAGLGFASILFPPAVVWVSLMNTLGSGVVDLYSHGGTSRLVDWLPGAVLLTLLEVAIAVVAFHVRRHVETRSAVRVLASTAGFLAWRTAIHHAWRLFI